MTRRLLSIERHQKIVEKVSVEEAIDFITLAKELNVSVMTVRRDIRELEKQGYLKLTRGGAYAQITRSIDILLSPRAEDQGEAKTIIGKYAASLIEPGEVIFIGAGSTTAQFVQYLKPDLNLTVITASIPHATFLAAKGFKVISTGGEIATDDIAQAEQVLVLADISKVGVKANYAICPLSDIDEIITTKDAEQAYLAECGDQCEVLASE